MLLSNDTEYRINMLWIVVIVILLAAIAALLWWRHVQDQDWQRELIYLNRHQQKSTVAEAVAEAPDVGYTKPNVNSSRDERKNTEAHRAVYERTFEQLRAMDIPKINKKLDALSGKNKQPEDYHSLPIFASAQPGSEAFQEIADQQADGGNEQVATPEQNALPSAATLPEGKPNPDAPIISLEEATRGLQPSAVTSDSQSPSEPQVITLEEATRALQRRHGLPSAAIAVPTTEEPTIIGEDDPALARTRMRTLSEIRKINEEIGTGAQPTAVEPALETIEESDIRNNLLRRQLARRPNEEAQPAALVHEIIREDEVLANLSRINAPAARRLRRISTASRESVIPETVRVDDRFGAELVRPKPKAAATETVRQTGTLSERPNKAPEPPQNHHVVELPPAPEPTPIVIDIAPPPTVLQDTRYDRPSVSIPEPVVNAYVTDSPRWSISDRLISRSADDGGEPEPEPVQTAFAADNETDVPVMPDEDYWQSLTEDDADDADDYDAPVAYMLPENDDYPLPGLDLLLPATFNPEATQTEEMLLENSITIEEKLAEFRVKVKVVDAYAGPVITRYEIEPDVGVRGNAVLNLEKDLARSLGVASIRVVETIPGKTCMGLELPNPKRQMIRLSEVLAAPEFQESKSKLTLALGQDITGKPIVMDLAKAPHLLVAGTTGSGKSVGVNGMILSMLFKARPEDVRMIMIDPKMLELSIYEGIPHLLAPVVTDMRLAANALNWCVNEMEKRYRLMSHLGVRNLAGYNQKIREAQAAGETIANPFSLTSDTLEPLGKLPSIVVVVDEFADLMMVAGKKIEELIARIAQKARAAGIHLILATQRPSVDVITGLIKANIPTRIAFQVSSKIDSRTILDQMGAENLLGQGDMLYLPPGTGYPQRVHGAFASDEEVHGIVEYLKQFGEPDYVDDILTSGVGSDDLFSNANDGRNNEGDQDPLYDEAVACVIKTQKATISSVQRYLRIGYNRAANLIEQMEADGIVSPADSANGKRTVLARHNSDLDG